MPNSSRGYNTLFLSKVADADQTLPVIQFANACIGKGLSIPAVAKATGVTRATVYNWFTGKSAPRPAHLIKIQRLIARWSRVD
jgi:DNA-binding transcriptional regulator YiaG